jgi:hypothetical protein
MFVSGEETILNRILRIGRIAQVSISRSVEQGLMTRENVLRFPSFFFWGRNVEVQFAFDVCSGCLHMVFASRSGHQNARPIPNHRKAIPSSIFSSMSRLGS